MMPRLQRWAERRDLTTEITKEEKGRRGKGGFNHKEHKDHKKEKMIIARKSLAPPALCSL
jgi:hypothetical protein